MLPKARNLPKFFPKKVISRALVIGFYTSIANHYLRHNNHHLLYYDKHDMTTVSQIRKKNSILVFSEKK